MAEFIQTMKSWARMCNSVPGKDFGNLCSDRQSGYICPLRNNGLCNKPVSSQTDEDWMKGEKIIQLWAAEHPEPVYPTWYEFLTSRYHKAWEAIGCDEIHADIAQKLGIEPKEG